VYRTTDYFEHVAALGRRLRDATNEVAASVGAPLRVSGYDAIPFYRFDPDMARHAALMQRFQAEMASRGVLLRRDVNFICSAHTAEQVDFVAEATRESLTRMKSGGAFG
jgi:aminotransferase MxcL